MIANISNRLGARAAHIRTTTRAPGVLVIDTRLIGVVANVIARLAAQNRRLRERDVLAARLAHSFGDYLS